MDESARFRDAAILSDVHLWDPEEPRFREALRFFDELPPEVDLVVVLGDLFDFWLGDSPPLARRFEQIIAAMRAVRQRGVTILYCEGNHDLFLDRYFPAQVGCETFRGERVIEVAGRRVHLSHGDDVNPEDHGYFFLRWFLRSWFVRLAVMLTPAWLHAAIGERASRRSRAYTAQKNAPMRELSHVYADRRIREGADVVVIGHTHIPERAEREVDGRIGTYLNTGLWLADGTRTWARINDEGAHLFEAGPSRSDRVPGPTGQSS